MNDIVSFRKDGLGARLINVLDVHRLAKKTNNNPIIIWEDNPGHCSVNSFSEIFDEEFVKRKILDGSLLLDRYLPRFKNYKKLDSQQAIDDYNYFDSNVIVTTSMDIHSFKDEKALEVKKQASQIFWNDFAIKNNILDKVDSFLQSSPKSFMGIHIRRGDMATHKKGYRRCVPLEEYEKTIMQYPDEFFYVATDEPELFNSLRLKFGDRVFRKNINSFSRDSKDISDAFVEILILANSTSLFGGKSAFVSLASFIGNLPLYQYKGYVPLKNSVKL